MCAASREESIGYIQSGDYIISGAIIKSHELIIDDYDTSRVCFAEDTLEDTQYLRS